MSCIQPAVGQHHTQLACAVLSPGHSRPGAKSASRIPRKRSELLGLQLQRQGISARVQRRVAAVRVSALFGGGSSVTPLKALKLLTEDPSAVLVDIRSKEGRNVGGSPDLKTIRSSPIQVPYLKVEKGQVKVPASFADSLKRASRIKQDSTVILLDSFGKDAPQAARQAGKVAKKILYVSGGAEGAKGWKGSGLPWKETGSFNFFGFGSQSQKGESGTQQTSGPESTPELGRSDSSQQLQRSDSSRDLRRSDSTDREQSPLSAAAALTDPSNVDTTASSRSLNQNAVPIAGAGLLLLVGLLTFSTGVERLLQTVGVIGLLQFGSQRLLFAKDRERTVDDIRYLIDERIALGEAPRDLQRLTAKLLEVDEAVLSDVGEAAASAAERTADKASEALPSSNGVAHQTEGKAAGGKEKGGSWATDWK